MNNIDYDMSIPALEERIRAKRIELEEAQEDFGEQSDEANGIEYDLDELYSELNELEIGKSMEDEADMRDLIGASYRW